MSFDENAKVLGLASLTLVGLDLQQLRSYSYVVVT